MSASNLAHTAVHRLRPVIEMVLFTLSQLWHLESFPVTGIIVSDFGLLRSISLPYAGMALISRPQSADLVTAAAELLVMGLIKPITLRLRYFITQQPRPAFQGNQTGAYFNLFA